MASNQMDDSISMINKNILLKSTTYPNMKFYPDIFDILDQDDEMEQDTNDKHMWEKIREEYNLEYKFDNTYDNMQEKEDEKQIADESMENINVTGNDADDDDDEIFEEQVLSQRLSQLSTAANDYEQRDPSIDGKRRRLPLTTTESTTKKFRTSIDDIDKTDLMPQYLLASNKLFDRMIKKIINITSPMDMDDLRQMAFFTHQIAHFNGLHNLWSAYLRAGIGSLKDDKEGGEEEEEQELDISKQIDRRYWPNNVKSIIQENPDLYPSNLTEEDKHVACQNIVYKHLREYSEKIQLYEHQFNNKKKDLSYWTSTIEQAIETFVQQYGSIPLQMKYNNKIAIFKCEYEDQILERQYQQQKPTVYQKQLAQDLYDTELQLETVKFEFIECQERIRCNKPPASYDCLEISLLSSSINTISNIHLRQQLLDRYEKLLQQTKTDLIAVDIAIKQANIYQYQTLYNDQRRQMFRNDDKHVSKNEITKSLQYLINKRSLNMKNKLKLKYDFTINYFLRSTYSQFEMIKNKENQINRQHGFLSNLIIDPTIIEHHLTQQQLQLLNRGPTYVVPGQLHLASSTNNTTIDNMIKKQYAPLKHQLAIIFNKYHTYFPSTMNFQTDTYNVFKDFYSIPLPNDIYQRAIYEKKLIQSIQCTLKKNNFLLRRTADQRNTFYVGHMNDFIHLSNQYMENNTDTYQILFNMNEMNIQHVQEQLKKKYLFMNSTLDKLLEEKRINNIIHKKLQVNIENLKLSYLYFLPQISTTNSSSSLQVQPMISAHHSITSKLAQYLKQLIRPLIFHHMKKTIFINEADFIQKLIHYTNHEHQLRPTTLFVTIKITNFHTMASHESIIHRLGYFLFDQLVTNKLHYTSLSTLNHLQSISIDTIKKLTELYLQNNIFYYNGKIYELKKGGGPNSLLFSEILSNIYLFTYDQFIFNDPKLKTELYGRYKDQIFFTWNQSEDELKILLDNITDKKSHIHTEISTGACVQFFNAQIENHHGHLYTCVYHDSPMSKYTLPYVIDHAKLNHGLWFRSALIRAVRFSSNFLDFNQEQISLVIACLSNGYSIDFIETQLKHFYIRFNAENIRFCPNQTIYEELRHQLFDFINIQRAIFDKNQEFEDKEYIFHFSYPYDYGPLNQFKRKFYEFWKKHFQHDSQLSHKDTKIVLQTKHIYSLNTLLDQQKPSHELLKIEK